MTIFQSIVAVILALKKIVYKLYKLRIMIYRVLLITWDMWRSSPSTVVY